MIEERERLNLDEGSERMYMNIDTGSVDVRDGWDYKTIDGDIVNGVDLGEAVEVVKDANGDWVEA